jgi:hypothetical protein
MDPFQVFDQNWKSTSHILPAIYLTNLISLDVTNHTQLSGLFDDTVTNLLDMSSICRMIQEGGMKKELEGSGSAKSRHCPTIFLNSERMQDNSHLGSPITQLRFEPVINLEIYV